METTTIVRMRKPGGVEELEVARAALGPPGEGEIRVRQRAIGLNFVDVYHRTGLYPLRTHPAVLGIEAAGVVEAVGEGVHDVRVGDRIAYAGELGAYAEARLLPAHRAIVLPDSISFEVGAVALARGITVHMLQTEIHEVDARTTALVHSAAGGLGSLLVRAAKARGATVIATVGSREKEPIARANGADHVIVGRDADFAAEVAALTDGRGVDVAYDGVGGGTLRKTLACVRPFGTVASFGQSAGPIPPLAVEELGPGRSLVLARPSVMHFMADRARYRAAADAVLRALLAGITPTLGDAYPLRDAARAHADLERGATRGCPYLVP